MPANGSICWTREMEAYFFWKARTCSDGHFRVAPAVHNTLILLSGYEGDAFALDETGQGDGGFIQGLGLVNMAMKPGVRWKWSQRLEWYRTGHSPDFFDNRIAKPNFIGNSHQRQSFQQLSLLDATSGKRLWHFQEISHDIWDLDLPAPPVLVSVHRGNELVDAVAGEQDGEHASTGSHQR